MVSRTRPCARGVRPGIALRAVLATALLSAPALGEEPTEAPRNESSIAQEQDRDSQQPGLDEDLFEPFNRVMFDVNMKFDEHLLEPAARGWDFVLPRAVQRSIGNFYDNLLFPIHIINNLLQGDLDPAAITLTRFAVNTTVGLAGLFDPATGLGLPMQRADFGQTLGKWGAPPGPYLVLPVWGSSNIRDSAGLFVDGYLGIQTFFIDFPILIGSTAINSLNRRALNLDTVASIRSASIDLYAAARNAYNQQRLEAIYGIEATRLERDADLYYFDFDEEEELP